MRWIQPQLVDDRPPTHKHRTSSSTTQSTTTGAATDLDRDEHQPGDDHHDHVGDPDDAGELEHDLRRRGAGNPHADGDAGLEWSLHVGA